MFDRKKVMALVRLSALAVLIVCIALMETRAQPNPCDNQCRMPKEFYATISGEAWEYSTNDCFWCVDGGACAIVRFPVAGKSCVLDGVNVTVDHYEKASLWCQFPTGLGVAEASVGGKLVKAKKYTFNRYKCDSSK
ncbi:MAG: hypothetical protein K2W96_11975 [Gemmataceae bacterium]|nr:hypothetical protein [Gemmataceae bacterium]